MTNYPESKHRLSSRLNCHDFLLTSRYISCDLSRKTRLASNHTFSLLNRNDDCYVGINFMYIPIVTDHQGLFHVYSGHLLSLPSHSWQRNLVLVSYFLCDSQTVVPTPEANLHYARVTRGKLKWITKKTNVLHGMLRHASFRCDRISFAI